MTSVNDDIVAVIRLLVRLTNHTGVQVFKSYAHGISSWIWMLDDEKRKALGITYPGYPNGEDLDCSELANNNDTHKQDFY